MHRHADERERWRLRARVDKCVRECFVVLGCLRPASAEPRRGTPCGAHPMSRPHRAAEYPMRAHCSQRLTGLRRAAFTGAASITPLALRLRAPPAAGRLPLNPPLWARPCVARSRSLRACRRKQHRVLLGLLPAIPGSPGAEGRALRGTPPLPCHTSGGGHALPRIVHRSGGCPRRGTRCAGVSRRLEEGEAVVCVWEWRWRR
jgi:hypothetical protein